MSIDQLPSGNWRARVMVDPQRYTATFPTRREAEEWLLLTRAKAATGELAPRMTVEQYVRRWLDTGAADPARHRALLDQHILPRLGRCQLAEVIPSDVKLLLNHVIQTVDTPTADEVYRTCEALFAAAIADGFLNRSPVPPRRLRSVPPPTAGE